MLTIPEGDVKWPLGGWLKSRTTPSVVEALDVSGHAAYDGPNGERLYVCFVCNCGQRVAEHDVTALVDYDWERI